MSGQDDPPFLRTPLIRRSSSNSSNHAYEAFEEQSFGVPSNAVPAVPRSVRGDDRVMREAMSQPESDAEINQKFARAWQGWLPTASHTPPPGTRSPSRRKTNMFGMFAAPNNAQSDWSGGGGGGFRDDGGSYGCRGGGGDDGNAGIASGNVSGGSESGYDPFDVPASSSSGIPQPAIQFEGGSGGGGNAKHPYDQFDVPSTLNSSPLSGPQDASDAKQDNPHDAFEMPHVNTPQPPLKFGGSVELAREKKEEEEVKSRFMYRRAQFRDTTQGGGHSGYELFFGANNPPSKTTTSQHHMSNAHQSALPRPLDADQPRQPPPLVFGRGSASEDSPTKQTVERRQRNPPHPFLSELQSSASDPSPSLRQWFMNSQSHRREGSTEADKGSFEKSESGSGGGGAHGSGGGGDVGDEGLGGGNKDWNKAWQEALELPLTVKGAGGSSRWERLAKLAADFKATAENYARVIVMERNLPDSQKTVKPLRGDSHLGIAGGQKYVVAGMLVKFCIDHKKIYGSEEQAQKVGNHELRGANIIFAASQSLAKESGSDSVGEIRVPLMVLIDFLGCRLVATSKLPISPSTLVFGSDDAGATIARQKTEASVMRRISTSLNLKPHLVADATGNLVKVDTCVDLEGHCGSDGRLYCLDTARLMPAESPWDIVIASASSEDLAADGSSAAKKEEKVPRWPTVKASHLVYQLRPKVVLQHSCSLSADAFSRFGAHDAERHNSEVTDATTHLLEEVIPAFAVSLLERHPFGRSNTHILASKVADSVPVPESNNTASSVGINNRRQNRSDDPNDDDLVPRYMHEAGINLRYMGRVYRILNDLKHPPGSNAALWQDLLLIEMVSRSVKHRVRSRCLSIRSSKALSAEQEFRGAIISEMNTVLSKLSSSQTALWHPLHRLQLDLFNRFGFYSHSEALPSCLPSHPKQLVFNSLVSGRRLFRRLVSAIGLYFLPAVYDPLANDGSEAGFEVKKPLDVIDLVDARPVLKQMAVVSNARAMLHYSRAMLDGSGNNARLLRLAAEELRNSLRSLPDDTKQRTRLANVLWHLASRSPDRDEALLSFSKAIDILKSAVALLSAQQKRSISSEENSNCSSSSSTTSPSIAFGDLVTLLEGALPTFARWVKPTPLPLSGVFEDTALPSAPAGGGVGLNRRASSDEGHSYFRSKEQDDGLPHGAKILAMFLEETTMTLFTGGTDRTVKAWKVEQSVGCCSDGIDGADSGTVPQSSGIHLMWCEQTLFEDRVTCIHATSTVVAVGSQDRRVALLSTLSGDAVKVVFRLDDDYVTCLRLMPSAQSAAHALALAHGSRQQKTSRVLDERSFTTAQLTTSRRSADTLPPQVLACGTAYRKVLLYAFESNSSEEWSQQPVLLRTIVVAYGRALCLRFSPEEVSHYPGYHHRRREWSKKPPAYLAVISKLGALREQQQATTHTLSSNSNTNANSPGAAEQPTTRQRRSSIGSGSRFTASMARKAAEAAVEAAAAVVPTDVTSLSLVVGVSDGSVLQWRWAATTEAAMMVTVDTNTKAEAGSTVSMLAPPLSGTTSLDPASLIRCTMIERLFREVNHGDGVKIADAKVTLVDSKGVGYGSTGSQRSGGRGSSRGGDGGSGGGGSSVAGDSSGGDNDVDDDDEEELDVKACERLVHVVEELYEVVRGIEDDAPTTTTTDDAHRRSKFESALPGLQTFLGRLELARRGGKRRNEEEKEKEKKAEEVDAKEEEARARASVTHLAEQPSEPPRAQASSSFSSSSSSSTETTLRRMLAEFKQHLRHLLTFPSPSQCNSMDIDITNGYVYSGGRGLRRRPLVAVQESSQSPSSPTKTATFFTDSEGGRGGGVGAAAASMGVGRPFVHSEMDPHISVYRVVVDPARGVLCSVGKDRLLRIWDLRTGAIVRALPATSIDVPIAVGGGVLAIVCGDRGRSFRAWGTGHD